MATIANLTAHPIDAANYTRISQSYITQWQSLATAYDAKPPHTTLSYNQNSTHSLLYNLYGDLLLNLKLVPQSVYDMQSAFYPSIVEKYGVPLDTRHDWAKNDEQMLAAATCGVETRGMFVSRIARWIAETGTNRAMTDLYDARGGE